MKNKLLWGGAGASSISEKFRGKVSRVSVIWALKILNIPNYHFRGGWSKREVNKFIYNPNVGWMRVMIDLIYFLE